MNSQAIAVCSTDIFSSKGAAYLSFLVNRNSPVGHILFVGNVNTPGLSEFVGSAVSRGVRCTVMSTRKSDRPSGTILNSLKQGFSFYQSSVYDGAIGSSVFAVSVTRAKGFTLDVEGKVHKINSDSVAILSEDKGVDVISLDKDNVAVYPGTPQKPSSVWWWLISEENMSRDEAEALVEDWRENGYCVELVYSSSSTLSHIDTDVDHIDVLRSYLQQLGSVDNVEEIIQLYEELV